MCARGRFVAENTGCSGASDSPRRCDGALLTIRSPPCLSLLHETQTTEFEHDRSMPAPSLVFQALRSFAHGLGNRMKRYRFLLANVTATVSLIASLQPKHVQAQPVQEGDVYTVCAGVADRSITIELERRPADSRLVAAITYGPAVLDAPVDVVYEVASSHSTGAFQLENPTFDSSATSPPETAAFLPGGPEFSGSFSYGNAEFWESDCERQTPFLITRVCGDNAGFNDSSFQCVRCEGTEEATWGEGCVSADVSGTYCVSSPERSITLTVSRERDLDSPVPRRVVTYAAVSYSSRALDPPNNLVYSVGQFGQLHSPTVGPSSRPPPETGRYDGGGGRFDRVVMLGGARFSDSHCARRPANDGPSLWCEEADYGFYDVSFECAECVGSLEPSSTLGEGCVAPDDDGICTEAVGGSLSMFGLIFAGGRRRRRRAARGSGRRYG